MSDESTAPEELPTESSSFKLIALASAAIGVVIARRALRTGWIKVTGKKPPTNPTRRDVTLTEAAVWAALSAATAAVIKVWTKRSVAAAWEQASIPNASADHADPS